MRIVFDTDPGNGIPGADIDDGLALGLALRSPEITVEAVTVVAGNVPVDRGVDCALEILEAAGRRDIPVHRGAARPLVQDEGAWRTRLGRRHDDEAAQRLWAGIGPIGSSLTESPIGAARAMVDLVGANPGEITVVAVGPLTNVAQAILLDRSFASKVKEIVWMGGAFEVTNLIQELNASYDPEATHVVLTSAAPLRIVPLDVTLRTYLRLNEVDVLDTAEAPLARYLGRTVRPWVAWLAESFGRDGCPLHDPLAVATLLDPTLVTTRSAAVGIELRGSITRGRTVSWDPDDEELMHAGIELPDVPRATIVTDVDNERFVALLLERLCR